MPTINLIARTAGDGRLRLDVPIGAADTEVKVVLIVEPSSPSSSQGSSEGLGWPPGFLDQMFGALKDDPIERPEQGEYESRADVA